MTGQEAIDHLEPATLFELCAGTLEAGSAALARAHLATCGVCQAELALALGFVDAKDGPLAQDVEDALRDRFARGLADSPRATPGRETGAPAVPPRTAARRRQRPLAWRPATAWLVAASLVVAGLGIWRVTQDSALLHPSGQVRALGVPAAWDLTVDTVAAQGWRLRWTSLPQATTYQLRVLSVSGEVLLERPASPTGAEIRRAELPVASGDRPGLLVRAVATGPGGFRRESPLHELTAQAAPEHPAVHPDERPGVAPGGAR
jgi:hypothetical protein